MPHVAPLWLTFSERRYVEPFCGGLAVALGLEPERALLNDANPHLINFYRQVQGGLQMNIEMRNDEALFYTHRDRFNEIVAAGRADSAEAAQLFYYLNRTCFNGLCRFNRSGEYNVPFGKYKTINYAANFLEYREQLSRWTFSTQDLEELAIGPDDFIYADPPYDVEFTSYSAGGFDWDDQVRTANFLAKHPGPVVISNQATKRIVKLYQDVGFKLRFLAAPRRISCTGDRTAAKEVLGVRGF